MKNTNVKFDKNEIFVGIDVAKDTLDVFTSLGRKNLVFENNKKDHRKIAKLCKRLNPERVCLEATGGYQNALMLALSEEKLKVSMVSAGRKGNRDAELNEIELRWAELQFRKQ